MSNDAKFIPGLFFKDKHENAPDFVIVKGSVKVADMLAWLSKQTDEWVNFDLKRSRDGKPYASVDDWKPSQGGSRGGASQRDELRGTNPPRDALGRDQTPDFPDDDIPF